MTSGNNRGHDVIMAGIGGRGVLVAGLVLAQAALTRFDHVVWLPSMTTAMRGGPCEAAVSFSSEPIASPLVWRPQAVVVMESSQLQGLEDRVQPGGVIIVEEAGLGRKVKRDDVRVMMVPAIATAVEIGDSQAANMVLLGVYIGLTRVLPPELVESQIAGKFGGNDRVLSLNRAAFSRGLKLASS
ncbi:MAG: 2-oxoacid:acceptor oxidoreductase family protein [Dehalococcoidia bacterium]